jgi:transcriptional regulator with XRE-family HTH domain
LVPYETLPTRLRRLRDEHGVSRSQLSRATVAYDGKGLAEVTIKAIENGTNRPGVQTIEAIAHALHIDPADFVEYRLALARRQLDEREVGLEQALAALRRFETALQKADPATPHAATPASSSQQRAPASGRAPRNR